MVQQNLVSFILAQLKQGKTLQQVNDFLLSSGYEKQEVESSVQYVLNSQTNPRLAEEQRIQQLSLYIQKQLSAGYDSRTVANFLISRGYPFYEVNSAFQELARPRETKFEHKALAIGLVVMFLVTGIVGMLFAKYYFVVSAPPEKLLDVETSQLTAVVQQGGELNFEVKLINFGLEKRFDVILSYKIIDRETQAVVLEQHETVALSTTLERVVTFSVPETLKTGRYALRADATYGDFTATSGFIFDVLSKELAEEQIREIKERIKKENITEAPEFKPAVPGEAPAEEEAPPAPVPEEVPSERPFYEGKTKQEAFEYVKAVSVREPENAIKLCRSYKYHGTTEQCLQMLSGYHKDAKFCAEIERNVSRDSCLIGAAQSSGEKALCESVSDGNLKSSCRLVAAAGQVEKAGGEVDPQELFSLFAQPAPTA